jgi:hypothetical protein
MSTHNKYELALLKAYRAGDIVTIAGLMGRPIETDNDGQYVIYTNQQDPEHNAPSAPQHFPPATCGCDSHPVTWSRGKHEAWICSATLPGSIQAWGNGPTPEEALAVLNANIVIIQQQMKELGRALPLPTTNQ